MLWETIKAQSLFRLKDKKLSPACKTYYVVCEFWGETKKNSIKRWSEHDNFAKDSEPARHLNKHIDHVFT